MEIQLNHVLLDIDCQVNASMYALSEWYQQYDIKWKQTDCTAETSQSLWDNNICRHTLWYPAKNIAHIKIKQWNLDTV